MKNTHNPVQRWNNISYQIIDKLHLKCYNEIWKKKKCERVHCVHQKSPCTATCREIFLLMSDEIICQATCRCSKQIHLLRQIIKKKKLSPLCFHLLPCGRHPTQTVLYHNSTVKTTIFIKLQYFKNLPFIRILWWSA